MILRDITHFNPKIIMMWINLKRIFKSGFISFCRNAFVSLSSVLIMVVTLFLIGSIIFSSALLKSSLEVIRDKVDVNVYFTTDAQEVDILSFKKQVEAIPEVSKVDYVSREKALENFRVRHQNDQITLQALDELNDNPLGAVLNIKAKDTAEYESIANYLNQQNISRGDSSIIDKINYLQNKDAIDRLNKLISSGEKVGFILAIIFALISILITFNTIRLAIFTAKDEISVMQLVGANYTYIKGPFLVVGILYGLTAGILTLILFYPLTFWLNRYTETFFAGNGIFTYYIHNFGQLFLIIMTSGIAIGAISSFLAVHRYLGK
jgi:cell division transport system permease protein